MDRRSFLGLALAAPVLPYVELPKYRRFSAYGHDWIQKLGPMNMTDPECTFTRGEFEKVLSKCTYGPVYK